MLSIFYFSKEAGLQVVVWLGAAFGWGRRREPFHEGEHFGVTGLDVGEETAAFAASADGTAAVEVGIIAGMFGTFPAPPDAADFKHEVF